MFVAGWPEASSYMGEYIALMMVGFLLVYVGVTIAAFSLTPFQQVDAGRALTFLHLAAGEFGCGAVPATQRPKSPPGGRFGG